MNITLLWAVSQSLKVAATGGGPGTKPLSTGRLPRLPGRQLWWEPPCSLIQLICPLFRPILWPLSIGFFPLLLPPELYVEHCLSFLCIIIILPEHSNCENLLPTHCQSNTSRRGGRSGRKAIGRSFIQIWPAFKCYFAGPCHERIIKSEYNESAGLYPPSTSNLCAEGTAYNPTPHYPPPPLGNPLYTGGYTTTPSHMGSSAAHHDLGIRSKSKSKGASAGEISDLNLH